MTTSAMHDTIHNTEATEFMKKFDFFSCKINLFLNKINPFCSRIYKNKVSHPVLVGATVISPIAAFPAGAGAIWLDFTVRRDAP